MPAGPTLPKPGPVLAMQAMAVERDSVRPTPEDIISNVQIITTEACRAKNAETLAAKFSEIVCLPSLKGR